jgi:hypothetical protein
MKKFVIAIILGCLCGAAIAASVEEISIAGTGAGYLSGTWVNTLQPKRAVQLKSAFIQYASPVTNETATVTVSKGGTTYTVDASASISNATVASVDFDKPVWCAYGETTTVTRTSASTGVVVKVMLVVE